ncbi:PucR family transcriptional regulator [Tersicoccus phoenicis]|uniref:PucR family transcriptional regulator n=1 Tax=Tersicoccus phoenicis TaxID=554083 RepID=UPI000A00CC42|nr:PucR family transcriptional regulator [Tersicoccus phoenicis]
MIVQPDRAAPRAHAGGAAATSSPAPAVDERGRARTLETLRSNIGTLSTVTLRRLDSALPWYRHLRPDERSALGLVAQKGIASFVSWYEKPGNPAWVMSDVFGTAPTELTRSISLQKALQLIRIVVDTVEQQVPDLASEPEQPALREAVLRYSREVAFAAADVYARAAESRGSWDSRLEALVVDGILRGESSDSLRSRIAALGWSSKAEVIIVVGGAPPDPHPAFLSTLRRTTTRLAEDTLVGIQSDRLVLLLGGLRDRESALTKLAPLFGDGPIVHAGPAASLVEAGPAAQAAFSALTAARAWPDAPRPVAADDLWPERLMAGDDDAGRALVRAIYRPLTSASNGLLETLSAYLSLGHSLEATARNLFVHTNTVRYRLRKVTDVTGWDPLVPREAFVLQTALVAGRLSAGDAAPGPPAATPGARPGRRAAL